MNGQHPQTDFELVQSAKSGNESAFHELVAKYYGRAYFTAYGRLGDADSAEDAAQDAFVAAYLGLDKLADAGLFSAWLISIVKNLCKNRIRTHQRREKVLESLYGEIAGMGVSDSAAKGESPFEAAEQREKLTQLYEAVNRLEPDLREMVLLRFAEDMNNTEIGKLLGIPHYTVGRRLEKACELMKGFLQGEELTCLAKLRPSKDAVAKTIAVTGAVSLLSAGSRAAILSALGDIVPAGVVKAAGGVGIVPAALNNVAGFLKTGAGKFFVLTCFTGLVILGAKNLTERSEKIKLQNQVEAARLAEITGKGGAGRSGSAGQSNRKKGGTGSSKVAADSLVRTNRKALKQDAITAAKNIELTCPLVMVTGIVTVGSGVTDDSLYVELWQNGKTLGDEVVENRRMAREKVGSDGSYRVFAPDGSGLHLEVVGSAPMEWSMPPRDELQTTAPVRFLVQDFALPETDILKGRVVMAESGAAAAGAKVRLQNRLDLNQNWGYKHQTVYANEKGEYQFDHVIFFGNSLLGAITTGTAPAICKLDSFDVDTELNLSLEKASGKIKGRAIKFPENAPLAGGRLSFQTTDVLNLRETNTILLDSQGRFEIDNLGNETIVFSLETENGKSMYNADNPLRDWIVESHNTNITEAILKAGFGHNVRGKVLVQGANTPLKGAIVSCWNKKSIVSHTITDDFGGFNFTDVYIPTGYAHFVNAKLSGFLQLSSVDLNATESLKSQPSDNNIINNINVFMSESVLVSGRITDQDGKAIPFATVTVQNEFSNAESGKKVETDENGVYRFLIPANIKIKILVRENGYAQFLGDVVNVTNEPIVIDPIALVDDIVIKGTIADTNGDPITDEVFFHLFPIDSRGKLESHKPIVKRIGTEFELRGNSPGNFKLHVSAIGYQDPGDKILSMVVGDRIENIHIRLDKIPNLSGRILDANGLPLKGEFTMIKAGGNSQIQNGMFSLWPNYPGKEMDIDLKDTKSGDIYTTKIFVEKTDQYRDLRFHKVVTYRFAVRDSDTKLPINNIRVRGGRANSLNDQPIPSNEFIFNTTAVDEIDIELLIDGIVRKFHLKRSELSATKINDIFVENKGSINVRFVDESNSVPIENVKIKVWSSGQENARIIAEGNSTKDGLYRNLSLNTSRTVESNKVIVEVLPPKPYESIKLLMPDSVMFSNGKSSDIKLGQPVKQKFRVFDNDGSVLKNGLFTLYDRNSILLKNPYSLNQVRTNNDGIAEFNKIISGHYVANYQLGKGVRFSRNVYIDANNTNLTEMKPGSVRVTILADHKKLNQGNAFQFHFEKNGVEHSCVIDSKLSDSLSVNLDPGEWTFKTSIAPENLSGLYYRGSDVENKTITIPDVKEFTVRSVLN